MFEKAEKICVEGLGRSDDGLLAPGGSACRLETDRGARQVVMHIITT